MPILKLGNLSVKGLMFRFCYSSLKFAIQCRRFVMVSGSFLNRSN